MATIPEALAVWFALAVVGLTVLVTYARVPSAELYHVSEHGVTSGLGRALVFLNFPVALAAVPVALIAAAIIRRRAATAVALLVVASAAVVPFVVDQNDLDAKPGNAVPAVGVALALLLTLAAARRGAPLVPRRLPGDPFRAVLAAALVVIAVPWLFAELGFYAPDPILADEPSPGEPVPAVHLGHHHGTDGVLLALTALALTRLTARLPPSRSVSVASSYLALLLVYGVANAAQDAWQEQVVKRGTTAHALPSVLLPRLTVAWGLLLVLAALVEALWLRRERRPSRETGPARESIAEADPGAPEVAARSRY